MKKISLLVLAVLALLSGTTLLTINLYGLTQTLAPAAITLDDLRFREKDVTMSREALLLNLPRQISETDQVYAERITTNIAATLAHIHWLDYHPSQFNQRVPLWENYILYFMGLFSGIPEFERYHFSSPEKSIERGIGICGDASILLSQLLSRQGINNKIVTYPGHVVVEADYGTHKQLLDADYGVVLQNDVEFYHNNPDQMIIDYRAAGFVYDAEDVLASGLQQNYVYWDGVSHFITNKFYFEKVSYWLKWLLPFLLLILALVLLSLSKRNTNF